jgi:hypothetical protein
MGNLALHGLVYAVSGILLTILAIVFALSLVKMVLHDKGEEKVISRELLEKQKLEIETKGDDIIDTTITPSEIRKQMRRQKKKQAAPAAGKYYSR